MKLKFNLFIVPMLLLITAAAFAQTPTPKPGQAGAASGATGGDLPKPKIAIINTSAFPENIAELKVLYDKLGAEFAPRETELSSMQASMAAKQKQLDENGSKMTPQQVRKLQDEIEQLKKDGQRKMEDYQADLQKREEEITGATYGKINEFLNKYVIEKGITLVFSTMQVAESNLLLYLDPKAEITQDFINAYNKAHPATTAQNATSPAK